MSARYEAPSAGGGRARAERLRVLTMNVLEPAFADGPARRRVVARALDECSPDVVALQEVVADDVAALADDGWHVAPHPERSPDGVSAVLASRRPFGRIRTADLKVSPRTARTPWCGAVAAEVSCQEPLGGVLLVHHKPSWPYGYERERERQAVVAAGLGEEAVAEGRVQHVVVLGDFDAVPDAASMRFWRGLQSLDGVSVCYQDAWEAVHADEPGLTMSPHNPLVRAGDMPLEPGRRIDWILARCGPHGPALRVRACERLLVDPVDGVQASDHYGLVADLEVPARAPGDWS